MLIIFAIASYFVLIACLIGFGEAVLKYLQREGSEVK